MEIIVFLLSFVFFYTIGQAIFSVLFRNPEYDKELLAEFKECRPHKWSYNKDDKLECINCSAVAGQIKQSSEDYE